jgi:futalosine hydrolase
MSGQLLPLAPCVPENYLVEMNILLVSSTVKEIGLFFDYYRNAKRVMNVDVLISGIGLTSTTYHLAKQISIKKPQLIIQAGIAGSFQKNTKLGTVVTVKRDVIADQMVIEDKKIRTLFDLELLPFDQYPYTKGWLVNKSPELKKTSLKKVRAVTVNEITTSKQKLALFVEKYEPTIESMEGAALHYVCLMEKISFIQLRAVSNYVGERNKKKWKMELAIRNLNEELIKMIDLF